MVNSSGSFKKKLYYTEPNVLDNIFHTDEVQEENYEDDDQEYTSNPFKRVSRKKHDQ